MRRILAATSLLLVFSCKNSSAPTDHIPPKVMKKIMIDVHLAETYSTMAKDSLHKNAGQKNMDSLARYYRDIFDHYHITEDQFTKSVEWYKNHPDDLDTLYNDIIPTVNGVQAALPKPGVK